MEILLKEKREDEKEVLRKKERKNWTKREERWRKREKSIKREDISYKRRKEERTGQDKI